MEMYTDPQGLGEKCGDINYSLEYDFEAETLKLNIIQVGGDLAFNLDL